jgi:hypothetical protein
MNNAERVAKAFALVDLTFEAEENDTPEITKAKLQVNASIYVLLKNMTDAILLINKR